MLKFASICPHPPILVPSIGQNHFSKVSSTVNSMEKLGNEIKSLGIDTIVIISPHGPAQMNCMSITGNKHLQGDFSQFGDDAVMEFENNINLAADIKRVADSKKNAVEILNDDIVLDHGAMVPLYFLTKHNPQIKIVPIAFSYLNHQKHFEFGKTIFEAINNSDEKIAVVASGDLSHRLIPDAPAGYSPKGKEFDNLLIKLLEENKTEDILNMDLELIEEAGECGLRSIIILLGVLSSLNYKFEKLSYEGPFGVGYLVGKFEF